MKMPKNGKIKQIKFLREVYGLPAFSYVLWNFLRNFFMMNFLYKNYFYDEPTKIILHKKFLKGPFNDKFIFSTINDLFN